VKDFCGRIVQTGELCFERIEEHLCGDCPDSVDCVAEGYAKQLSFEDKFLIEDMNYSFLDHAQVKYHTPELFLELLCLDSINAINREYENGDSPIISGIYANLNQGKAGELCFLPGTPIRGIRIVVKEAFYDAYLKNRFPHDELNVSHLTGIYGNPQRSPKLRMIFRQIRDSIHMGVDSEIYYESKIVEILYMLINMNTQKDSLERTLSCADLAAVKKTRKVLDERLANTPKIVELATLTCTSPAKLQRDFKTAFGAPIHSYVQTARMSRALERIEQTDEPLYIIAQEVGCKKPSRFTEIFKKTYGMTPDEYRRNLNGKIDLYDGKLP
jgi:AraC-like DNA-binding protein